MDSDDTKKIKEQIEENLRKAQEEQARERMESIKEIVTLAFEDEASRRACPYDGVLGKLPFESWPKNFHDEFDGTRNSLLRKGHSPEQLRGYMDELKELYEGAALDPNNPQVASLSGGMIGIEREIEDLIRFSEAVQLGEEKGLAYLTDKSHSEQVARGKKFDGGRKRGAVGPIRRWIRRALKNNPNLKNLDLWEAIRTSPPKGWVVMETAKLGKYVERPDSGENVSRKTFCTYASEERKLLRFSANSEVRKAV